jgi:hypothetical protein
MRTIQARRSHLLVAGIVLLIAGFVAPTAVYVDGLFGTTDVFGSLGFPIILSGFAAMGLGVDVLIVRSRIARLDGSDRMPASFFVILFVITAIAVLVVAVASLYAEALAGCMIGPC